MERDHEVPAKMPLWEQHEAVAIIAHAFELGILRREIEEAFRGDDVHVRDAALAEVKEHPEEALLRAGEARDRDDDVDARERAREIAQLFVDAPELALNDEPDAPRLA